MKTNWWLIVSSISFGIYVGFISGNSTFQQLKFSIPMITLYVIVWGIGYLTGNENKPKY